MKKKLLLIFAPLLLSTSFASYAADEVGKAQQEMNRFQSAIKQFQKKMKFHQRCMQGKCSQEEKAQAQAELKKTAKIAIPTALGVIVVAIGGAVVYRKRGLIKEKWQTLWTKTQSQPEEEIVPPPPSPWAEFWFAIAGGYTDRFDKAINDLYDKISEEERALIPWELVQKSNDSSREKSTLLMLKALIRKDPDIVNVTVITNEPLLTYALQQKNLNFADILLDQAETEVHPENVPINELPLKIALMTLETNPKIKDIRQKIMNKYSQEQLDNFISLYEKQDLITHNLMTHTLNRLKELAQKVTTHDLIVKKEE